MADDTSQGQQPQGLSWGKVGGLMQVADSQLLVNLGLGIASAARYGGNIGEGLMGGMNNYLNQKQQQQQLAFNRLNMQMAMARFPIQQRILSQIPGLVPGLMGASQPQGGMMGGTTPSGPPQALTGPPGNMVSQYGEAPPSQPTQGQVSPLAIAGLGAAAGLAGLPGGEGLTKYAELQAQYDPRLATQMAAAKGEVAVDLEMIRQAQARGDTDTVAGLNAKLQQDLKTLQVSPRGIVSRVSPSGDVSLFNLPAGEMGVTGSQGNTVAAIPGAAAARGELAGAEARGKATGDTLEFTDDDKGSITGTPFAKYYVPKSAITGGPGGAPAAPRAPGAPQAPGSAFPAPPAAPKARVSALPPGTASYETSRGTQAADYLTESQKNAEVARDTNYSLDQMLSAAKNVQLGAGAPTRAFAEKYLSALGQQFGVAPSQELTNYTELEKYANKVAFSATRQMGAREATQIVQLQIESNPNKSMTPDAFNGVALSMKAMNNYILDKNVAMQAAGKDAQSAAAKWTQQIDPRVWAITLSPQMGQKWAEEIGKNKISQAYPYMQPEERKALIANIPPALRQQWLGSK